MSDCTAQYYADAISECYSELCKHVSYNNIIFGLVSGFIITIQEKQDLDALQVGHTTRCSRMLDLILEKKRDLGRFTAILKESHPYLAEIVEKERKKIESGESLPHIKVVEQQFKSFYKDRDFQLTEKLPGEDFTTDVSDESQLVPLFITVEAADKEFLKKQRRGARNMKLHYRYKQCSDVPSVESVFDDDLIEGKNRLYVCTGIAGVGKTVTVHRLAWQWANDQNKCLQRFSVLIVIPLSKVNCSQALMDILSDEGLGYISVSKKDTIQRVLEKNSRDVLFVIDGGDEVEIPMDAELKKLIKGQLFPESKVLIMARSDIQSLTAIADLNPDIKIHINGTNLEGVRRYIGGSLMSEQASEDVIRDFMKLVLQVDILHIPLYLAMVSVLFDHHWIHYANFANLRIPKTATEVLNSFMCMIIKIWLKKINRCDEMSCCNFDRCAVEKGCKVPIDIRAKLVNMGRMSFECLLAQRYHFSEADLETYLVDRKDVQFCGMFRLTRGTTKEFCFIHQIFQQYLSAVYLSHVQLKDAVFLDHISKKDTLHTMESLFSPLELCMKFIFGMCPAFGKKIMERVTPLVSCCMNQKSSATAEAMPYLNLQFESMLCRESGDPSLVRTIEDFLLSTETPHKEIDAQLSGYQFESVHSLLAQFSDDTCITLLDRIYNLEISKGSKGTWCAENKYSVCGTSPERQLTPFLADSGQSNTVATGTADEVLDLEDGWCVLNKVQMKKEPVSSLKSSLHDELFSSPQYVTLIIDNLDVSCYCLLSKFCFLEIEKLVIVHSVILDVEKLLPIFPNLHHFEVSGKQCMDANVGDSDAEPSQERRFASSGIEHVKIHSDERETNIPSLASTVFQNNKVKYISLARLQVFEPLQESLVPMPQLNMLVNLLLSDCSVDKNMEQLCHVLRNAPSLLKIHIHNTSGDMCDKSKAEMLMTTISENLPSIQQLALVHTFNCEGVDIMCSFLSKIPSLKQLSLGEWDVMDAKEGILKATTSVSLCVYIWHVTRREMRKALGSRPFKVSTLALLGADKSSHAKCFADL